MGFKVFALIFPLFFISCGASTYKAGITHLNNGEFLPAYDRFRECAQHGNSDCYNALGVMYARKLIRCENPMKTAINYYIYAARLGNETARQNLIELDVEVPNPDLVKKTSPELQRAYGDAAKQVGHAIGLILFE